jgi:hypothetical protein
MSSSRFWLFFKSFVTHELRVDTMLLAAVAAQTVAEPIHSFLAVQGDEQFQAGFLSFQVGETGAGSQDGVLRQHRPR